MRKFWPLSGPSGKALLILVALVLIILFALPACRKAEPTDPLPEATSFGQTAPAAAVPGHRSDSSDNLLWFMMGQHLSSQPSTVVVTPQPQYQPPRQSFAPETSRPAAPGPSQARPAPAPAPTPQARTAPAPAAPASVPPPTRPVGSAYGSSASSNYGSRSSSSSSSSYGSRSSGSSYGRR